MSYCTIADVCSAFPQFKQAQTGSISDTQIQGWIDDRKARIRSALLNRGFDPDTQTNTTDQTNFLRSVNRDGAISDMGNALQGTITLQPGEYSLAQAHRSTYEKILKEIGDGKHDSLFQPSRSRTGDPTPLFQGVGGAETDPDVAPDFTKNRSFSRNQVF